MYWASGYCLKKVLGPKEEIVPFGLLLTDMRGSIAQPPGGGGERTFDMNKKK